MSEGIINTNYLSLAAQRNLAIHTRSVNSALERLSTGQRINRSSDDTAGLSISNSLKSDIRAMNTALRNTQDGKSILQITEGTLNTMVDNLQRVRELTVQAANDTNSSRERQAITQEIRALIEDINRLSEAVSFNGINLLDGSAFSVMNITSIVGSVASVPIFTTIGQSMVGSILIHVGPNSDINNNTIDISRVLQAASVNALGITGPTSSSGFANVAAITIPNTSMAHTFLRDIDGALAVLGARRAEIGALENRIENTAENLMVRVENFSQSNSVIRDLDVAQEMSFLVQSQILQQSSLNILMQANNNQGAVLKLLQI